MFDCFHAFGNNAQVQCAAKRDNRAGDGCIIRIVQSVTDKALVNFQTVDRELTQSMTGRSTLYRNRQSPVQRR